MGIKACVFDAYGTLFDFASAARKCRDALGDDTDRLTTLWRDKQLQYSWFRAAQGLHADFWQVTGDALERVAEGWRDLFAFIHRRRAEGRKKSMIAKMKKPAEMRAFFLKEMVGAIGIEPVTPPG